MTLTAQSPKKIYIRVDEPERTPTANTIGYWELNWNTEDTKNDYGVTTYTSTDYDAVGYFWAWLPTYTTGKNWKQCAYFDWTRALELPSNIAYTNQSLTISAWVNYTSASAWNFWTWSSIFQIRHDGSTNGTSWALFNRIKSDWTFAPMFVHTQNSSGQYGQAEWNLTWTSLSTWVWHNVVFTFNEGTAKYYIDWTLQYSTTVSWHYLRNTTPETSWVIGGSVEYSWSNYYSYLTWKIQDVIYESWAWSATDVANYYNATA